MPYWYWNGRITPAETRRQIKAMIDQGVYQAVVFPWDGMEVRYLSEDYWSQFGAALEIARQLHFTLNFADEYDWPSGHAWDFWLNKPELSRVLSNHPEFRMKRLKYTEKVVEGPSLLDSISSETPFLLVAGRLDPSGKLEADTSQIVARDWRVPDGKWLITSYQLVPAVGGHNTRVDLLNPDAVDTYLELVYGEYARRFSKYFGTTLRLTLADHEGAYGSPIAYTPTLWKTFTERHGYDLRKFLPLLVHGTTEDGKAQGVRRDYLDTISQLYVDSFSGRVAEWCRRHHLQHATSLYEEQLYIQVGQAGDMFRHWRAGSAVEIDALLERARMPLDFKEAVSVAHFDHKPLIVENQGLQGHSTYFSLEKARLGTNMCLLWGADRLVPYFDYDQRKTTWPPQWFVGQPFWRYFHHYANYVNRAQFMNEQGAHIAPVALYYPLETAFANSSTLFTNQPHRDLFWNNFMDQTENLYTALRLELARKGWDYHILDSHYLKTSTINDSQLDVSGEKFRVLILPPMTDINPASVEKIRAFAEAGGEVLAVGQQPLALNGLRMRRFDVAIHSLFMDHLDYLEQIQVPDSIQQELLPLLQALKSIQPPEATVVSGDPKDLYWSHRKKQDIDWYWVVNDSAQPREATLRFRSEGVFEKWDAETGERSPLRSDGATVELRFDPWDAYFVVRHPGAGTHEASQFTWRTLDTLPQQNWRFTPEAPVLKVPYAHEDGRTDPVWLSPERLSNRHWWLIGPFPYNDHKGFYTEYPPQIKFNANATYPGAFGQVKWKWIEASTYFVTPKDDLALPRNKVTGIYYAYANIYSPQERTAQFRTAFADSIAVWWNGQLKMQIHRHPKWLLMRDPWAETKVVHIKKGWNTVLLKIGPSLMVPTSFMFRLIDGHGATLRDLVYSSNQDTPHLSEPKEIQLTVKVPPGAIARKDGTPVTGGSTLQIKANTMPEQPFEFRSGTVPFTLQSWTDSALGFYSGTAIYETEFRLNSHDLQEPLFLDLGAVGVAAEVWLNGKKLGERAWKPFRFEMSGKAVTGMNRLKIRVANSDAGWQSQGDTIYPKGSWGLKYRTELDRLNTIRPNGLEGPVRILTTEQR